MSEIKRQKEISEQYGVMQDWLILFAESLNKNAYLENLKPVIHRKKFDSIEEKMADIKNRIGFDIINKFTEEVNELSKEAAKTCDCGGGCCSLKKASYEHSEKDISKMKMILKYINDMVEAEPHLSASVVIAKCKDAEGLSFNSIRIDESKLKKYIEKLLNKHNKNDAEDVTYIKREDQSSLYNGADQADYYSHAKPDSA